MYCRNRRSLRAISERHLYLISADSLLPARAITSNSKITVPRADSYPWLARSVYQTHCRSETQLVFSLELLNPRVVRNKLTRGRVP